MVKRTAKLSGGGVVHQTCPINRRRHAPVEALENRIFLSAAATSVVNVLWKGAEVAAVQGEYVIQTDSPDAWSALAAKEGFTEIQNLGGQGFYQFDTTLSPAQIQQLSRNHPLALAAVEPNLVGRIADTFPDDPLAIKQYNLRNTGQVESYDYNGDGVIEPFENQAGTPGQDIDVQQAWDLTTGSSSVVVAVLDTGIDLTHPDLVSNIWTNPNPNGQPAFPNDVNGWNFVGDNNDVSDDNGHGTNVAGIIGAVGNNAVGVTGVNWNVSLLPVKVAGADGSFLVSDEIAGINYVTMLKSQGVNIVAINESLNSSDFPFNIVENNAVKAAGVAGIVDVVSSGDSAENLDTVPGGPSKLSLNNNNVITVAATDNQGKLADFSDFGAASVDVAAPGINILSTVPTEFSDPDVTYVSPGYGSLSGTSQAAPQVTGIIALEAAANPAATPQQLKAALLQGVTPDPYLASVNELPAKVATAGVANAYNAVKNILDQFVSADITRSGNWAGFFGSDGAYIVGDSTAFPSFVNVGLNGASPVILKASTHDVAGLQNIDDLSTHIEAYDASASSETIDLDFTDGNVHRVGIYIADLDHKRRAERIQIIDSPTGLVLDTKDVGDFTKGEYLFYNLRGSVQIKLTNLSGPSAVFSGLFFDPVPIDPDVFVSTDATTEGINWRNTYGSQGADIIGDTGSQLPSYVSGIVATGATTEIVKVVSNAPQSLQRTFGPPGIQAYLQSAVSYDIDVNINNTQMHQITLYLADYDKKHRSERIEVLNPTTRQLLYSQDFFNFTKGVYASFDVPGSVIFHVIPTGGPSAVVSGIFFDAAPGAQVRFAGTDSSTEGNWPSAGYGSSVADIIGDNFPGIDDLLNPTITVSGATERILAPQTRDPRALVRPGDTVAADRIAAYIFSETSMTLAVNFGDNVQHHVALYFADYEGLRRVESITITDPTTGDVLTQQRLSNFAGGKYLLFDMTGPVDITITADSVSSAVFSGLFSD